MHSVSVVEKRVIITINIFPGQFIVLNFVLSSSFEGLLSISLKSMRQISHAMQTMRSFFTEEDMVSLRNHSKPPYQYSTKREIPSFKKLLTENFAVTEVEKNDYPETSYAECHNCVLKLGNHTGELNNFAQLFYLLQFKVPTLIPLEAGNEDHFCVLKPPLPRLTFSDVEKIEDSFGLDIQYLIDRLGGA